MALFPISVAPFNLHSRNNTNTPEKSGFFFPLMKFTVYSESLINSSRDKIMKCFFFFFLFFNLTNVVQSCSMKVGKPAQFLHLFYITNDVMQSVGWGLELGMARSDTRDPILVKKWTTL